MNYPFRQHLSRFGNFRMGSNLAFVFHLLWRGITMRLKWLRMGPEDRPGWTITFPPREAVQLI